MFDLIVAVAGDESVVAVANQILPDNTGANDEISDEQKSTGTTSPGSDR